jgi:cellulose synthase/poly-beta-1,6-N-acetylglucosamine synthase-like glycosyltransferase
MKTILKYIGAATAASVALEKGSTKERNIELNTNGVRIEVHVPTLNEEGYIEDTLETLSKQELVMDGDVDLAIVDSKSDDKTVELSEPYVDEVYVTDRGKLTAMNQAANKSNANIIAYADAGDIYPKGWLNNLLSPFEDGDVVGSYGPSFSNGLLTKVPWALQTVPQLFGVLMQGRNSAVRTFAHEEIGGFDESVDQNNIHKTWVEEEFKYPKRLSNVGEVVFVPSAGMIGSDRRVNLTNTEFKEEILKGERM